MGRVLRVFRASTIDVPDKREHLVAGDLTFCPDGPVIISALDLPERGQ
jgi:hypothetical protein